jgi:hypothetical protein
MKLTMLFLIASALSSAVFAMMGYSVNSPTGFNLPNLQIVVFANLVLGCIFAAIHDSNRQ